MSDFNKTHDRLTVAETAGTNAAAALTAANAALKAKGAWSGATAYVLHDVVGYGGKNWRCIQAHTNQTPTESSYWTLFTPYRRVPTAVTLTDGATVTLDASLGDLFRVTLGGNRTLAITNPTDGQTILLEVTQDATGSRTLTPGAEVVGSTDNPLPWTLTTTVNKTDVLGFVYNAASSKWRFLSINKGF